MSSYPNQVRIDFLAGGSPQVVRDARDVTVAIKEVGTAVHTVNASSISQVGATLKSATADARLLSSSISGAVGSLGIFSTAISGLGKVYEQAFPGESQASRDFIINQTRAFHQLNREIERIDNEASAARVKKVDEEGAAILALEQQHAERRTRFRESLGGLNSTEAGQETLRNLAETEEREKQSVRDKFAAQRAAQAAKDQAALDRFNQEQADAENARLRERDAQRQLNERQAEEDHERELARIEEQNDARIRGIREYQREVEAAIRKQRDLAFANTNLANLGRGGERAFAALLMRTGGR